MSLDRQQVTVNNQMKNKRRRQRTINIITLEVNNTTKQPCTKDVKDNNTKVEYGDTARTRSGHISRKLDRLEYR